jgi:tRNA pseudouridine38-40 synthase
MKFRPYTYLFYIQYLGFRYHGWQVQPGVKTIQGILNKNFRYVLGPFDFTILGASRTDAGVSCNRGAFQLFSETPLDLEPTLAKMNLILPDDIKLLEASPVAEDFNIIHSVKGKSYQYHFSMGEKIHPFNAANLVSFASLLDIELMREALKCFLGTQDFRRYCSQDKVTENYKREIYEVALYKHPMAGTGYVPQKSYVFRIVGKGFLRYQIRIMMAALVELGKGSLSLQDIQDSLFSEEAKPIASPAPAHGLILEEVVF